MNRTDRLQAMIMQLQTHSLVRGPDLARRFEVSLRTIYRDMLALQEAGVPLRAEAGVGYMLAEGWTLPPLMLTRSEAAALLTGGKLVAGFADAETAAAFDHALDKLRAALSVDRRDYVENLESRVFVQDSGAVGTPVSSLGVLATVQEALATSRVLQLRYCTPERPVAVERQVESLGLALIEGCWNLVAWCRLRAGFRQFRLDRIESALLLDETFLPQKFQSESVLSTLLPTGLHRVRVLFGLDVDPHRFRSTALYGYVGEQVQSEGLCLEFLMDDPCRICLPLLTLGDRAEILEPTIARETMCSLAAAIAKKYAHS